MKHWHNFLTVWLVLLPLFFGLRTTHASSSAEMAVPLQSVDDWMPIYYRLDPSDQCTNHSPITLGDFVKKTLPNEWIENWGDTPGGLEALKAGAIAIRTFAISAYNAEVLNVGGQNYYCTKAWRQQFDPNKVISNFPNSVAAVDTTNGIMLTHPDAATILGTNAIDAQYRDDTGQYTAWGTYPWLQSVYDPISAGTPKEGMGQQGSKRWAWGLSESGEKFPKWDYRRILVHYYTGIDFAGLSPHPHEGFRNNMLKIEGVDPHIGLSLRKGEERTGIRILLQNTGSGIGRPIQAT